MFVTPDQRRNLETRFDTMSVGGVNSANIQMATKETDIAYSEATATHILWVLIQKAEAKSMDVQKVLRSFDEDGDGLLNYKEFFRASAYLGLELTPHDLQNVITHLGGSKEKPIDYSSIESKSQAIPPTTHGYNTSPQAVKDMTNTYRLPKSDILCQIARKIEQKRRRFTVLKTFRRMDSDRDGYITKGEFDRGLQEVGFHLSVDVLSELFDRFDLLHIGKIDYTQFANIIDPSSKSKSRVLEDDGVLISMPGRKRKIEPQNKGKIERPYGLETDPNVMIKEHNAYLVPKTDLLWQLAMKAEAKGRNGNFVRNVFRKFDSSQNGTVSSDEFRKGLNTVFGIEVKDDDFDELMKRFDPVNSGYVNYVEFARLINPAHYAGQSTGRMLTPSEKIALTQQKQPPVLQKIARKLQVKRNGIRMAFRGFDDNHDCLVTTKELRQVLFDILNIELTDEEFSTLVSIFDPDGTGRIDHNEFVCCVDSYDHNSKQFKLHDLWNPSPVSAYRRRAYESTISETTLDFLWKISVKMQERKKSTREIFRKYDRNHDGKLSLEELRDCIESLGWSLKNEILEDVFSEMDITKDGEVDYRELVKFIEVEDLRRNRLEFKSIQEREVTPPSLRARPSLSVQKSDLIYQLSQKIEEKVCYLNFPLTLTYFPTFLDWLYSCSPHVCRDKIA